MGFEIENYPHPLLTALISNPQTQTTFLSTLSTALENNCDSLITPIFADEYISKQPEIISLDHCFILSDEHLKKIQLNIITPLVNDCIWDQSQEFKVKFFNLLIGYSSYLNLRYFAINFNERHFQSIMETLSNPQVAKQLRKCVPNMVLLMEMSGETDQNAEKDDKIWKNYIDFRRRLQQIKFPLFIEIGLELKSNAPVNRVINRWKSEKVTYIITSTNSFTENSKGFVILPAKHQRMVIDLLILRGLFSLKITNESHHEKKEQRHRNLQEYYKYVLYVFRKFAQNKLRSQKQAINLQDFLQNPLQPYADNLESATYQVFEFDQQKYDEYQGALQQALETFPKNRRVVIYYIGSGRGGLLFNVFAAAKKSQRKVFVYAIEKNIYPIQTIKKRLKENQWENNVKIVHTDIRDYVMPQKPDIFLSELLGGFGDNELSPQCLYWAEKNIEPETICIPTDYTSYIRPVSYQYGHRNIQMKSRQIYYTVNYGNYYTNFASQEVWKFIHPLRKPAKEEQVEEKQQRDILKIEQDLFNRHSHTKFTAKQDIMINGFAGYFTSGLYQHCELSILPEKPTFGMYSWYPLFFCFLDAEYLAKGQDIEIDLWRKYTNKKVWYEWSYKIGDRQSIVHNKDGAYVAIEL